MRCDGKCLNLKHLPALPNERHVLAAAQLATGPPNNSSAFVCDPPGRVKRAEAFCRFSGQSFSGQRREHPLLVPGLLNLEMTRDGVKDGINHALPMSWVT